jgi:hypothetical protein
VEWRRGHCGSLAPWGAEQGWRVLRCRQARLSGRRHSDRRAKAATLAGRGRVQSTILRAAKGGPQRSVSGVEVRRWRRHSRRRLTSLPGGRWLPGTPVAKHLAWRGPPGARRQALECGCASIRTEGLPAAKRRWRWSRPKRHSGELCWPAECEPHRPNEHLHSEPSVAPRSRFGERPNTHEVGIITRATGEPQERRCEALARRGRRERASECAKRGALEVQGALELARGIRSRASGRASELARAKAASPLSQFLSHAGNG